MAYKRFIDVASYQPDSYAYFKEAVRLGVAGCIVKISEGGTGTKYVNPKAGNQITNAKKNGLVLGAYHFLKATDVKDAQGEANYFIKQVRAFDLPLSTPVYVDVESDNLPRDRQTLTNYINAFIDTLKKYGFKQVGVYSNKDWFDNRIIISQLHTKNLWCANYGVSQPGVANTWSWQYSSQFKILGANTDISFDFNGCMTHKNVTPKPQPKPKPQKKTFVDSRGVVWFYEKATFKLSYPIKLRWGATLQSSVIMVLQPGDTIKYDAYAFSGGQVWLRQPRGNGKYAYLSSGEYRNGKRVSSFGAFK